MAAMGRPVWLLAWLLALGLFAARPALAQPNAAPGAAAIPVPADLAGQTVFLDAALSPPDPWLGQTAVYSLRLFRSVAASGVAVTPPAFDGFDAVALPGQTDAQVTAGTRRYVVSQVAYALTPRRSGSLSLAAPQARLSGVPGRPGPYTVAGPALAATVRPLPPPPPGIPDSGLVGRLTLAAALSPASVAVGGQAGLDVTVSGQGNLRQAVAPALALPEGLLARPLGHDDTLAAGPHGDTGSRVFRFALTPVRPGRYVLPGPTLAVFDPQAETWSLVAAPEIVLAAEAQKGVGSAAAPPEAGTGPNPAALPESAFPPTGSGLDAGDFAVATLASLAGLVLARGLGRRLGLAIPPALLAVSAGLTLLLAGAGVWFFLYAPLAARGVTTAATPLLCAPEPGAEELAVLPPGTPVVLGATRDGYLRVEGENDLVGWTPRNGTVTPLP
jgi:hypothetical protein